MARTPVIVAALAAAALAAAAVVATTPAAAQEGAVPAVPAQVGVPAEADSAAGAPDPQREGTVNGFGCIAGPTVDHDPYDENGASLIPSAPVPDDPDGTVG